MATEMYSGCEVIAIHILWLLLCKMRKADSQLMRGVRHWLKSRTSCSKSLLNPQSYLNLEGFQKILESMKISRNPHKSVQNPTESQPFIIIINNINIIAEFKTFCYQEYSKLS